MLPETDSSLRCPKCARLFPADALGCPEHGATLVDADPLSGRVLGGRYRLDRCVGKGGMGAVYDARHVTTEQRVAVKVLAEHLSKDLKLVARFRREAMAAGRLSHENCVQVYDFGEDEDGTFYIVMEFVDGVGLGDELRRSGPLAADRVARIGVQLLAALEAAHDAGILHRDLKPQNVMLTQKAGRPDLVKVVDFGIAKFLENSAEDQAALTVPGTIFGTPEYMSPEQARGDPLDARSDLYSAAVVLWHILLGRSPFRGRTVRETLMKVFSEEPPRPSQERPSAVPPQLEDLLLRGLSKDPSRRFADARTFRSALLPFAPQLGLFEAQPREPIPGLAEGGGAAPETVGPEDPAARPRAHTVLSHGGAGVVAPVASAEGVSPLAPSAPTLAQPAPGASEGPMPSTPDATTQVDAAAPTEPPPPAVPQPATPQPATPQPAPEPAGGPVAAREPAPAPATTPSAPKPAPPSTPPTRSGSTPRAAPRGFPWGAVLALALAALAGGAVTGAGVWWLTAAQGPGGLEGAPDLPPGDPSGDPPPADPVDLAAVPPADFVPNRLARDAAMTRAERALEEGRVDEARAGFEESVRADPSSAKAHAGLATLAFRQGDLAVAKRHIERAMALDERYARQLAGVHALIQRRLQDEGR